MWGYQPGVYQLCSYRIFLPLMKISNDFWEVLLNYFFSRNRFSFSKNALAQNVSFPKKKIIFFSNFGIWRKVRSFKNIHRAYHWTEEGWNWEILYPADHPGVLLSVNGGQTFKPLKAGKHNHCEKPSKTTLIPNATLTFD